MEQISNINPVLFKELLVIVGAMCGLAAFGMTAVRFFRAPQPLRVTKEPEFMTAQNHQLHCTSMDGRVTALERRMDRVEEKMESNKQQILAAMTDVRRDVSHVAGKVAGLEERTDATNTALAVQDKKLDAILEKL